ncbi:MAG: hypothetical protein CMF23_10550 [Ignavibacteriae bacterium]|nr:hypothetical protein [Ignavibacteriota bacterium]|tara:strand:- start:18 stop:344 length:327 start_codon:yes stop_codon:yes gene_type:complete
MSQNYSLGKLFLIIIIAAGSLFAHLYMKKEISTMNKMKNNLETKLTALKGKIEEENVNLQKESAQDSVLTRVKRFNIPLERYFEEPQEIYVDGKQVERLQRIIEDKYE